MRYYTGYCFTAYDLFETFNKKQLKIRRDTVQNKYGVNKKQLFCASVLIYCFYLILLEIIENNVIFVLPLLNNKTATIYVRPITGDEFKIARQRGAFADIDILGSNFTGYQLTYSWLTDSGYRYKPIYINKRFKDIFIQYINEGKQYY